jgi:hypothetical protein
MYSNVRHVFSENGKLYVRVNPEMWSGLVKFYKRVAVGEWRF